MRTQRAENMIRMGRAAAELLVGTFLTAAAFGLFILPQNFAAAGVTGFADLLISVIPISLSAMVLLVNLLFLVLGYVFLGKEFTAKTIVVSLTFPVMLDLCSMLPALQIQNPFFHVLAAGITLGTGAGLIIRSGASSGGFGTLAVILNERRKISIAIAMNVCDAMVILMQAASRPIMQTIYGILVITLSAAVVGWVTQEHAAPQGDFLLHE